MTLLKSGWSTVKDEYGSIDNVLIDGLTVLNTVNGRVPASRFVGHNEKHRITNVTMRNVTINGEKMTDLKMMKVSVNDYCEAITIE